MRPRDTCWLVVAFTLCACEPPNTGVADAAHRSKPHTADFVEFCQWARRAHEGRLAGRDRDALAETTFAPLRHTQGVLAAWLVPVDVEQTLAMPSGTELPATPWVAVRNPRLGTLHVASFGSCPVDVPKWWRRGAAGSCVFMAADIEVDAEQVRIIVAYRD